MPGTKRTTKSVSYHEPDDNDDDDFIPTKTKCEKKSKLDTKQSLDETDDKDFRSTKPENIDSKSTNDLRRVSSDKPVLLNDQLVMSIEKEPLSVKHEEKLVKCSDEITPKTKRMKENENDSDNSSSHINDNSKRRLSLPLGFPMSKINIPSPHVSRVGLSRKSLTIKPLHPNITPRINRE